MTHSDKVPTYFSGLDGLRAVSVMIVFVAHAGLGYIVPGGFGVTVFFFLSGFLITSLLIREHDTYGRIALPAFYQRRLVRLMPPLLITMSLAILAVLMGYANGALDPWTIFSQIFFFFNYYAQTPGPDISVDGFEILWSLSVEEQFYLFFPFVFIALARSRWHIPVLVGAVVATLIWRWVRFEILGHGQSVIYISTDTRIDSILYGCLLAVISARHPQRLTFLKDWQYAAMAVAVALLLVSFLLRDPLFRATLRYSLQGLALIPIFYLAVNLPGSWLFAWLNWKPVRKLGQYSYTFYLAHLVIIQMLIFNGLDPQNLAVMMPVAFVLSMVYCALVYRYIEKPLQPLRSRLTGHG